MRVCLLVTFAFLLSGSVPSALAAQVETSPVLHPGDAVRIAVWRQAELSGEFPVASDGTLQHPLYREVEVAGVPIDVVESRLRTFLERYETNPAFVIQPLFRVFVAGEVRQPSLYTFAPSVTLARAIALAGGPSERGRLDKVRLIRGTRTIEVDLTHPDGVWASSPIRSGDHLLVARRTNVFRDYIVPTASVLTLVGTVWNLVLRLQ